MPTWHVFAENPRPSLPPHTTQPTKPGRAPSSPLCFPTLATARPPAAMTAWTRLVTGAARLGAASALALRASALLRPAADSIRAGSPRWRAAVRPAIDELLQRPGAGDLLRRTRPTLSDLVAVLRDPPPLSDLVAVIRDRRAPLRLRPRGTVAAEKAGAAPARAHPPHLRAFWLGTALLAALFSGSAAARPSCCSRSPSCTPAGSRASPWPPSPSVHAPGGLGPRRRPRRHRRGRRVPARPGLPDLPHRVPGVPAPPRLPGAAPPAVLPRRARLHRRRRGRVAVPHALRPVPLPHPLPLLGLLPVGILPED